VNTIQHATMEEAVFSVDPTDAPTNWLDSDHILCIFTVGPCPFRGYISDRIRSGQLRVVVAAEARDEASTLVLRRRKPREVHS
jgi:hypothetical protein